MLCLPNEPPRHRHPFPAGNPAKLGDSPYFLVLERLLNPENPRSVLRLPPSAVRRLQHVGLNFWAFFAVSSPAEFLLLCRRLLPPC
ncbi:hypothetical protein SLEP1_g13200 [Rubroshorea leprosula]|uniref:Uncharacterized protein n=1 Tax=Rubroshorea leprosula TaxID=152421 RepID=A0AAV5INZ1_9ROSI|nr:hypothetical protein SLEP1_g13200 [Rubroshorea leprosula]